MIIKPRRESHFYDPDGTPRYGAGLRDARNNGLFPSVTTVNGIVSKPGLDAWSLNLLLDCAWRADNCADMGEDEWKRHVRKLWKEAKTKAPELGSKWHEAIQAYLEEKKYVRFPEAKTGALVKGFIKEAKIRPIAIEETFSKRVAACGYGGRIDLKTSWEGGEHDIAYVDWKTQGKPLDKLAVYEDMGIQLVACAMGHGGGRGGASDPLAVDLVSVLISTVEPAIKVHVWPAEHYPRMYRKFLNRLFVWYDERNFWNGPE